jgi:hypothetical protein
VSECFSCRRMSLTNRDGDVVRISLSNGEIAISSTPGASTVDPTKGATTGGRPEARTLETLDDEELEEVEPDEIRQRDYSRQ